VGTEAHRGRLGGPIVDRPAHDGYLFPWLGGPIVGAETHAWAPGIIGSAILDTNLAARCSLKTGLGLKAMFAVPQYLDNAPSALLP